VVGAVMNRVFSPLINSVLFNVACGLWKLEFVLHTVF